MLKVHQITAETGYLNILRWLHNNSCPFPFACKLKDSLLCNDGVPKDDFIFPYGFFFFFFQMFPGHYLHRIFVCLFNSVIFLPAIFLINLQVAISRKLYCSLCFNVHYEIPTLNPCKGIMGVIWNHPVLFVFSDSVFYQAQGILCIIVICKIFL